MPCKNICGNFKAVKIVTGSPYLGGEKWCGACCIFIEWEGIYCPCCTRKLRISPRSKRSWCYATLRSIRHNQDENKLIELSEHNNNNGLQHPQLKVANSQIEKILMMGS
ncbi:MAG: hypothetical protein ACJ71D_05515 [Nitrososphaera sp.]